MRIQEKRYRSMQEHIRRAHPEYYISKLPATEESFLLMINTPPSERPHPESPASTVKSLSPFKFHPFNSCNEFANIFKTFIIAARIIPMNSVPPERHGIPMISPAIVYSELPVLQLRLHRFRELNQIKIQWMV